MKQAGPKTRFEMRNALEVLRKIAKSVMLSDIQVIKHGLEANGTTLYGIAGIWWYCRRG